MNAAQREDVRARISQLILDIQRNLVARKRGTEDLRLSILEEFLKRYENSQRLVEELGETAAPMFYEVQARSERLRLNTMLGGKVAFEFRSTIEELDRALEDARAKRLPIMPEVEYYVVTNWDRWRIYRVLREPGLELQLLVDGSREEARDYLEQIVASVDYFKLPPHPSYIEALYTLDIDDLREQLRGVLDAVLDNELVKPLFEAYRRVMEALYAGAGSDSENDEFFKDLYVRHTLMHMMVMASLAASLGRVGENPVDACSGASLFSESGNLNAALPYLNWWRAAYSQIAEKSQELVGALNRVVENIAAKASLVDWKIGGEEDVFRALYEILVEPDVRRKIGEYYTPLWLVDRVLLEFDLGSKLVMDPFCGSGTFLVRAFYEKLRRGRDPDEAYEELIGLDINPLAVAVARAELIIAYKRATNRLPPSPPRIYHADTLAAWFGGEAATLADQEHASAVDSLKKYILARRIEVSDELARAEPKSVLSALSKLEQLLAIGMSESANSGESSENSLREFLLENLGEVNPIERLLRNAVCESQFVQNLAKIVKKHRDGTWAVVLASATLLALLDVLRPHIIVTNPPWVPTTDYKASYASKIREQFRSVFKSVNVMSKRAADIVNGSDIAVVALYKALKSAREGVGFVMNREQSFWSRASVRAGIIATYAVLRSACASCSVKLIEIDYDAFGHGIYPAIVVAIKTARGCGRVELFIARPRRRISKDAELSEELLDEAKLEISYDDYIEPGLAWATESSRDIAKALSVRKVSAQGGYIRGALGGERKRGEELYAGLVVERFGESSGIAHIKLLNLEREYQVPSMLMDRYGVSLYKLYYLSLVMPFKCYTYNILLSNRGEAELKNFLRALIEANERSITMSDLRKLQLLIEELRTSMDLLSSNSHYVVYSRSRVFAACVPEDLDRAVSSDTVSYAECYSSEQAHYYAAVLNYLAYVVAREGRSFTRTQYSRPLQAIAVAGLSWQSVPGGLRGEVSRLSQELSRRIAWPVYSNKKKALLEIAGRSEFSEIIELLDRHVRSENKEDKLRRALDLVSTRRNEGLSVGRNAE